MRRRPGPPRPRRCATASRAWTAAPARARSSASSARSTAWTRRRSPSAPRARGLRGGPGRAGARRRRTCGVPGPSAAQRRAAAAGEFWRRDPRALSTLAAIALLAVAVALDLAGARRAVAEPAYLASMPVGGLAIGRAAIAALRRRWLDMNVLMSLAAVGAVGIGAYAEGAWVLVLFALGTTLETFALDRTRRSVEALAELAPAEARLVERGTSSSCRSRTSPSARRILVRPGERVPLDGM